LKGDRVLLTLTLVLLGVGATAVFCASSFISLEERGSSYSYLADHSLRIAVGLLALAAAWFFPFSRWRRLAPAMALAALIALGLVLLPVPFRVTINGVHRWLRIGPAVFQPSEFARVALVIYLAWLLSRKGERIRNFAHGYLPPAVAIAIFAGLVAVEPSMGCAIAISATGFLVLFAAGARVVHLFLTAAAAVPVGLVVVLSNEYQWQRIRGFLSQHPDQLDRGWQLWQSMVALGSGGVGGRWGESMQKMRFLPYPHTDFIFAVIGEQWGFIGALAVLALIAAVLWRGVRISREAESSFDELVAIGLTGSIGIYAFLNVAVVTGLLPTTGLPLPFVSYGGSAIVMNLLSIGILLNISRRSAATPIERRYVMRRSARALVR